MNRKTFLKLLGIGTVAAPAVAKAASEADFSHWDTELPKEWQWDSAGLSKPPLPPDSVVLCLHMKPKTDVDDPFRFIDEYEFTIELANGDMLYPERVSRIVRDDGGIDFEVSLPDGRSAHIVGYPSKYPGAITWNP